MNSTNGTPKSVNIGEVLADYITDMPYGETIRYQDIEKVIGERYGTHKYYRAISKAKSILVERGKMIVLSGRGEYRTAYPGDYVKSYCREVRLAGKRIKNGGKILNGAPTGDMTNEEVQTFNRVSDFHQRLNASIGGSVVEVKKLTGKDHPLMHTAK